MGGGRDTSIRGPPSPPSTTFPPVTESLLPSKIKFCIHFHQANSEIKLFKMILTNIDKVKQKPCNNRVPQNNCAENITAQLIIVFLTYLSLPLFRLIKWIPQISTQADGVPCVWKSN